MAPTVLLKLAFFVILTLLPVLLLALGPVEPYGAPHPEFPSSRSIIEGKAGSLDLLGEAILHRSLARKEAVRLKNMLAYDVFRFVDTPKVVSGRDGWLFYKGDFWSGTCFDERTVAKSMARIDALTSLAEGAGVAMTIAISPDKSTLYPEYAHPMTVRYWACKEQNAALLRRMMRVHAPLMVDHTQPLLAEKARNPGRKLYFERDTHWTEYGAALALRQLLGALDPKLSAEVLPPPRLTGQLQTKSTDIGRMLVLDRHEECDSIDAAVEESLRNFVHEPAGTRTVVLRDSFYGTIRRSLQTILPGAEFVQFHEGAEIAAKVATAHRVIVNSVERNLVRGEPRIVLAPDSPLGRELLRRNMALARGCSNLVRTGEAGSESRVMTARDIVGSPEGWAPGGPDPRIVVAVPAGAPPRLPCVRATLDVAAEAELEIFLPRRDGGGFEPGLSTTIPLSSGRQMVSLMLPAYLHDNALRIDFSEHATLRAIEFGTLDVAAAARAPLPE